VKKKPVAAKDENKEKILAFAERITEWLERSAAMSKQQAAQNRGRFDSLADACEADARNYLAMAKQGREAIADALSRRAVIVAALLFLMGVAPVRAEESRLEVAATFGAALYADMLTTEIVVSDPLGVEFNPMHRTRVGRVAWSAVQIGAVTWAVHKASKTHPRRAKAIKWACVGLRLAVATINTTRIIRQQRRTR